MRQNISDQRPPSVILPGLKFRLMEQGTSHTLALMYSIHAPLCVRAIEIISILLTHSMNHYANEFFHEIHGLQIYDQYYFYYYTKYL